MIRLVPSVRPAGILLFVVVAFHSGPWLAAKDLQAEARKRIEPAVEVYRENGVEAAYAHLEREADRWIDEHTGIDGNINFRPFFPAAWKEGQVRSGRDDALWGALLYEWMHDYYGRHALLHDYQSEAFSNLISTNAAAGRRGRIKVLLDQKRAQLEESGFVTNPTVYSELRPIFNELPDVRLRSLSLRTVATSDRGPFAIHY